MAGNTKRSCLLASYHFCDVTAISKWSFNKITLVYTGANDLVEMILTLSQ